MSSETKEAQKESRDEWPTSPEDYELTRKIGEGAFAKVYVAKCPTKNIDVAIKVMDLEKVTSNLDHLRQEVTTMKLCRHKNVLPLYTSFNLDEDWIAFILREVCHGLDYLHSSGWVHRDIKAGNILLNSSGDVVLSDFGVAGILTNPDPINHDNNRNTFVGTPLMKQSAGYTEKADIWSLGITALELAKSYAPCMFYFFLFFF
eukprot:GSMAST32.ASY1.ANO1.30.1 assembled CDS